MKLLKIALLAQFSNKKGTFILFIVPFILMLVIGSVIIASDPQKLPTAVLINDHSSFSRSLIASINQSKDHAVKYTVDSEREGHRLLQQGKIVYLMTIPPNFSRDLIRGDRPQLMIEIDATATNKALTINNALTQLVNKDLKGSLDYLAQGQPYSLVVHERYNPEGLMKYKVIPGLIGVMFMVYAVLFLQLFFIGKNRSRLGSPPQTSSALSLTVAERNLM